jgi:hypothetical protein
MIRGVIVMVANMFASIRCRNASQKSVAQPVRTNSQATSAQARAVATMPARRTNAIVSRRLLNRGGAPIADLTASAARRARTILPAT